MPLAAFSSLGLDSRYCDRIHDVFSLAAARKVVAGPVEALEDRADRSSARETLGQLVGDVARI